MIPVVNHARLKRLELPPDTKVTFDLNTVCVIIMIVGFVLLFKRGVDIRKGQSPSLYST